MLLRCKRSAVAKRLASLIGRQLQAVWVWDGAALKDVRRHLDRNNPAQQGQQYGIVVSQSGVLTVHSLPTVIAPCTQAHVRDRSTCFATSQQQCLMTVSVFVRTHAGVQSDSARAARLLRTAKHPRGAARAALAGSFTNTSPASASDRPPAAIRPPGRQVRVCRLRSEPRVPTTGESDLYCHAAMLPCRRPLPALPAFFMTRH